MRATTSVGSGDQDVRGSYSNCQSIIKCTNLSHCIGLDWGLRNPPFLDYSTVYRYPYAHQRRCFGIEIWGHEGLGQLDERGAFIDLRLHCDTPPNPMSASFEDPDIAAYFASFILFWHQYVYTALAFMVMSHQTTL